MCGCMLMHALMDHDQHQHSPQSAPTIVPVANTTKCGHCGFPLQQNFSFCPSCGMSLNQTNCPACGQKVETAWSKCAYCGSPLGTEQTKSAHV